MYLDKGSIPGAKTQPADQRSLPGNLSARRKRPCGCRAGNNFDEISSAHHIPSPVRFRTTRIFKAYQNSALELDLPA